MSRASDALARAFHDDPFWDYTLPDPDERKRKLHAWFPRPLRYGARYGTVDVDGDDEAGVAIWLSAEGQRMTIWQLVRGGLGRTPLSLGREAFGRMQKASTHLDRLRHDEMRDDFAYLWILGLDPSQHGRGRGTATIAPGLSRADAAGQTAYLETYKERNLAFYGRQGFRVRRTVDPGDGTPPFWTLERPPGGG